MAKISVNPIQILEKSEYVFTVSSLLLYFNCIIILFITNGASEGDGVNILDFNYGIVNLLYILNYLLTATLLILRWQKTIYFISKNILFLVLMLWIPLSFIWSANPDETLTGSVGMIGTTLFGLYLASRYTPKEQLNLLGWACGIAVILSIVFIIALPKYGIMSGVHAGAARGVFIHKNIMGKFMVLSNAIFLLLARDAKRGDFYPWLGVAGSTGLILASTSTASLLNSIMLSIIIFFSQIFQLKIRIFAPVIILAGLFYWAFSVWSSDLALFILGLFGKDLTLTGRTDIWPFVIDKIQERPWLGYGFNAFWGGINGESAYVIRAMRWPVPDSHNGFLDFLLNFGLLGFSIFITVSFSTLIKSYQIFRNNFSWIKIWPFIFIAYLVIINFTESSLASQNSVYWVLYTAVVMSNSVEFKHVFSPTKSLEVV